MSKIKNGGLDQHGAKPFELQQFETAGVEGVNIAGLLATSGVVFGESANACLLVLNALFVVPTRPKRTEKANSSRGSSADHEMAVNPSHPHTSNCSSNCSSMTYDGTVVRSTTARRVVGVRDGTSRDRSPSTPTSRRVISFRNRITRCRQTEVNTAVCCIH